MFLARSIRQAVLGPFIDSINDRLYWQRALMMFEVYVEEMEQENFNLEEGEYNIVVRASAKNESSPFHVRLLSSTRTTTSLHFTPIDYSCGLAVDSSTTLSSRRPDSPTSTPTLTTRPFARPILAELHHPS
jgi:hypothetical protein